MSGTRGSRPPPASKKPDDPIVSIECIIFGDTETATKDQRESIERYIGMLGLQTITLNALMARERVVQVEDRFQYFCGICWKMLRKSGGSQERRAAAPSPDGLAMVQDVAWVRGKVQELIDGHNEICRELGKQIGETARLRSEVAQLKTRLAEALVDLSISGGSDA